MALESIATRPVLDTTLNFDQINSTHEHLTKARCIVEMVSSHAHAMMDKDSAQVISGSLWAVTSSLDALAVMLGLDPKADQA